MKNKQVLFLLLFAFACNNHPGNGTSTLIEQTSNRSAEQSLAAMDAGPEPVTEDAIQKMEFQIGQVGNIKKGKAIQELYTYFDSTRIQQTKNKQSGNLYTIYGDSNNPDIICTALQEGSTIDEIIIQGTVYKTGKGIGVGSTFAELTKAYHVASIQADYNQLYIQVEELQRKQVIGNHEKLTGILFEIGFDVPDRLPESRLISPASIPPDARIVRVIL